MDGRIILKWIYVYNVWNCGLIELSKVRVKWQAIVNTIWVPLKSVKSGNFLTTRVTVSFSILRLLYTFYDLLLSLLHKPSCTFSFTVGFDTIYNMDMNCFDPSNIALSGDEWKSVTCLVNCESRILISLINCYH